MTTTALQDALLPLLKTHFGYDAFRPNQLAVITDVLAGKDVLAIMPTGGGKSLCYQLSALYLKGTTIVISPLIALMKDQVDVLRANGIAAAYYNSTLSWEEQQDILSQLRAGKIDLFYVAPESLAQLETVLQQLTIALIAVDEAHCISAWGHDFRPAYTQLGHLKKKFKQTPLMALTATADAATQDDIVVQLGINNAQRHLASFNRANLFLEVRPGQKRLQQIINFLEQRPDQSGIVYCLSRKGTETLAEKLTQAGFDAQAYHAGMQAQERAKVQEDFVNDRVPIICATIAFGMGIDKSNVRWVIHYNLPKNVEGYYQEIGRAGRDGLPADTLLFYSYADVVQLRKFIDESGQAEVQAAKLERMQQFAEAQSCRRMALLSYFGEAVTAPCGHCDNCKHPPQLIDGTLLTQKIGSAVARLKEKEPMGMLIDVLRGAKNTQVYDKGYQHIKTYGAVTEVSWQDLQQYIIQLLNQGVLEIDFRAQSSIKLTPLAWDVLKNGKKVQLVALKQPQERQKKKRIEQQAKGLFAQLRVLRQQIAQEQGVPAYVVFSDASLKDMEERLPGNKTEFAEVSGVGAAKLEKYAEPFLQAIEKYLDSQKPKLPTHHVSYQLLQEGFSPADIAQKRDLAENTIYGHFLKMVEEGTALDLYQFITLEEVQAVKQAKTDLTDPEGLKPYYLHFKETMPYWKIKIGLYLIPAGA